MRAIPINQTAQFRMFLTSSALAVGNVVAMNNSGVLVKADKSNSALLNVVGFVMTASAGGALVSIPVRDQGIVQNASWSFVSGKPVYLSSTGGVTQDTSSFVGSDWIVELGTAIGVNQIQINIRRAVANSATSGSMYAITAGAVFDELAGKATLSVTPATAGKLAMFEDSTTLGSANTLSIPAESGTIITDASSVVGQDYS